MKTEQPQEVKRENLEIVKLKGNDTPENRVKFLELAHGFLKKPMHTNIADVEEFVANRTEILERILQNSNSEIFILVENGEFVGYSTVEVFPALGLVSNDGYDCMLREIYIKEDLQRTGAGKKLFGMVEDYAKQKGCARISLATGWMNDQQRGFYENMGCERRCDFAVKKL